MPPINPEKRLKRYVIGLLTTAFILGIAAYLEYVGILKSSRPLTIANVTRGFDLLVSTDVSTERRPDGVHRISKTPDRLCTLTTHANGEQVISAEIRLIASPAELGELAHLSPSVGTLTMRPPLMPPHVQSYDRDILVMFLENSAVFESSSDLSSWLKNGMMQYSTDPNAPPILRSLTDRKLEASYHAGTTQFSIRLSLP